jgi:hypothetical protein
MNKKTLAVCLYGTINSIDKIDLVKDTLLKKFSDEFDLSFFQCFDNLNQFINLKKVSFLKRSREIELGDLFDICLAVHTDYVELLDSLFFKDVTLNTLFFVKGVYRSYTIGTGIYPWIFYSHSLIFDKACEFEYNTIPPTDRSLEDRFYYHLKTLYIDTECINSSDPTIFEVIN